MKKHLIATALSTSLLASCASIVSDSNYPVAINSTPDGATFVVTNKKGIRVHSGTTPTTLSLKSSAGYFSPASYNVVLKKEGYADTQYQLKSTLDGWYLGNILLGGAVGMLFVDPATGAMWKLPGDAMIPLEQSVASDNDKSELKLGTLDAIPEQYRSRLVKVN